MFHLHSLEEFSIAISGTNFNIAAGIGFIALFGICIQNGVIIISVFQQNLAKRMSLYDSLKSGVMSRVRPVVMTALMAIFGLLPAAISQVLVRKHKKTACIVIVGGLSARSATLLIFPCYSSQNVQGKHAARSITNLLWILLLRISQKDTGVEAVGYNLSLKVAPARFWASSGPNVLEKLQL